MRSNSESRGLFGLFEVFKSSPLGPGAEWQTKTKTGINPDLSKNRNTDENKVIGLYDAEFCCGSNGAREFSVPKTVDEKTPFF